MEALYALSLIPFNAIISTDYFYFIFVLYICE